MAAIASSEFVSLCQAQLRLLTQQMSESSAAVYITDYLAEFTGQMAEVVWDESSGPNQGRNQRQPQRQPQRNEPNFIPVVSYPESVDSWIENFERSTAWNQSDEPRQRLLPGAHPDAKTPVEGVSEGPDVLQADHQLVVPLVYAEVVVGLMVAIRRDRPWESEERHYIENLAQSLAAGCVLEHRSQWLQSQIADKRDLQSRQSEIFHNLLHQFRNPLTAVTTFGQLLVRRLEPEDPNQKIATGIVRESKRLREMVAHFDETVAIGDADLQSEPVGPRLLPPATVGLLPSGEDAHPADDTRSGTETDRANLEHETMGTAVGAGLGHALTLSAQYLPDIVEPILAVTGIVAMEKGVSIQTQVANDTPAVWGEEEALGEVISNLVDNAVKYSPAGAAVWVQTGVSQVRGSQHYQGVVVGDTGPGIPQHDLARLFERNYRGIQAAGEIPGTGLGLAIAQSLMAQMQGSIEVISPAKGTPWMPEHFFDQRPTNQPLQTHTSTGPGSVFIVWLQEVERL